jgi:hydrogenase expression/formation protein HypE
MRIKGVLFDFDGTLTCPGALDFPAIKKVIGCPAEQPILEFLETQHTPRQAELLSLLEAFEDQAAQASFPNQGAEKCLSDLKKRGLPIGILTRNRLSSVKKALKRFANLSMDDFAAVITRDVSRPKPHPDGVIEGASRMGIDPSELLVVGDFRFDVMAGKSAGARTVLLTNGKKPVVVPGDPEPDHIVRDLGELATLLGSDLE